MGHNHSFGGIFIPVSIFLFFLLLLLFIMNIFSVSSISPQPILPPPSADLPRSLYSIKKPRQSLFNDQERLIKNNKDNKNGFRRKKGFKSKNFDTRTFSAMLPKGFVPPSGSSPCHNEYPSSITFFCHLSSTEKSSP